MKTLFNSVLFIMLTLTTVNSFAQQEMTVTATAANTVASRVLIDDPGLTNNLNAIILAVPLGNTATLNPHPIGAWYYNNKWWIQNTDNATIPIGSTFKVQVFLTPDTKHFTFTVNTTNSGAMSCLGGPELGYTPDTQVSIFQNHAPDNRSPSRINPFEARVVNSNSQWCIENVNGTTLYPGTTYNVVISVGAIRPIAPTPIGKPTTTTTKSPIPDTPKALPIGIAGGDLSGTYPNPIVHKFLGRPLSNVAPTVGQLLRWDGTQWEPVTYSAGAGLALNGTIFSAQNTMPMWNANQLAGKGIATSAPAIGQVLKWNGTVWSPANDNGSTTATPPQPASMQTFFKNPTVIVRGIPPGTTQTLSDLTHPIVLSKRSRLVISGMIDLSGEMYNAATKTSGGHFLVTINNIIRFGLYISVAPRIKTGATISNFMIDLEPGNYNVEFQINNPQSELNVYPIHSSIMVIPLE